MPRLLMILAIVVLAFSLSGCMKGEATLLLNPDGSGKLVYNFDIDVASIQKIVSATLGEPAPKTPRTFTDDELYDQLFPLLAVSCEGFEAWAVSPVTRTGDGRLKFEVTGYFHDANKLRMCDMDNFVFPNRDTSKALVKFESRKDGTAMLELIENKPPEKIAPKPAEDPNGRKGLGDVAFVVLENMAIERLVKEAQKSWVSDLRSEFVTSWSDFSVTITIKTSGLVKGAPDDDRIVNNLLQESASAKAMLDAMDGAVKSAEFLRRTLNARFTLLNAPPEFYKAMVAEFIRKKKYTNRFEIAAGAPLFPFADEFDKASRNPPPALTRALENIRRERITKP